MMFFGFAVFRDAEEFNANLEKWDTSRVTDMYQSRLSFLYCALHINIQVMVRHIHLYTTQIGNTTYCNS